MKVAIQLAIFVCICSFVVSSYTSSSSTSTCLNYESDSSYKWCRYLTTTSTGNYCTSSDTSYICGGSPYDYRCSTDSNSYLPQNSKKLLCPTDYTNCNSQTSYLYSSTDYRSLSSSYFGTSTICWYRFISNYSSIKSITIYLSSLTNASVEVYYESSTNTFNYKGSLSSGCSMDVNVTYDNPVWVLATPSSSSAYISVKGTASSSYGSTSASCSPASFSSVSNHSSSKYDLFVIMAILFPIGALTICLVIIVVSISSYNHLKNSKIRDEEEALPVPTTSVNQLNMPMDPNQMRVNQTHSLYQPNQSNQLNHQTGPLPQQPGMLTEFNSTRQNLGEVQSESVAIQDPRQTTLPMIYPGYTGLPPQLPLNPTWDQYPLFDYHPVNDNSKEEEKGP